VGGIEKKTGGGYSKLSTDMLIAILLKIDEDSQISLKDLVYFNKEKFDIDTSISAIHRALDKMNIIWKNVVQIPIEWNMKLSYPELNMSELSLLYQYLLLCILMSRVIIWV